MATRLLVAIFFKRLLTGIHSIAQCNATLSL